MKLEYKHMISYNQMYDHIQLGKHKNSSKIFS